MPYIKEADRDHVRDHGASNVGELTYELTEVIVRYQKNYGLSFRIIAEIRGALVSALDEYNRRVTHNYENVKLLENGDVYNG